MGLTCSKSATDAVNPPSNETDLGLPDKELYEFLQRSVQLTQRQPLHPQSHRPLAAGQYHLLYKQQQLLQNPSRVNGDDDDDEALTEDATVCERYPTRLLVRRHAVRPTEEGVSGTHIYAVRWSHSESDDDVNDRKINVRPEQSPPTSTAKNLPTPPLYTATSTTITNIRTSPPPLLSSVSSHSNNPNLQLEDRKRRGVVTSSSTVVQKTDATMTTTTTDDPNRAALPSFQLPMDHLFQASTMAAPPKRKGTYKQLLYSSSDWLVSSSFTVYTDWLNEFLVVSLTFVSCKQFLLFHGNCMLDFIIVVFAIVAGWVTVSAEHKICIADVGLTVAECNRIVAVTEQQCKGNYAAYTYAKQTLGCREFPALAATVAPAVHTIVSAIIDHCGSSSDSKQSLALDDREPHMVKYDVTKKERQKLDMHTDKSEWTFLIAVSNGAGADYTGGGTYFECLDATVHVQRGHALIFPGKLRHCGQRITAGLRFLLVGFLVDKAQPSVCSPKQSIQQKQQVPQLTDDHLQQLQCASNVP